MSRRIVIAISICLGLFTPVRSVEAAIQEISESKRGLIRQVMELTLKGEDVLREVEQQIEQLRENMAKMPLDPSAPPEVQELWRKRIAEAGTQMARRMQLIMQEVLSSPEVTQAVESFYNENFSEQELRQVVDFYKGPVGQKWLDKSAQGQKTHTRAKNGSSRSSRLGKIENSISDTDSADTDSAKLLVWLIRSGLSPPYAPIHLDIRRSNSS